MSADTRGVSEVNVTAHARGQYHDRSSRPTDSILAAWRDGDRVDLPAGVPVPYSHEARYDAVGDVVIFRRGIDLTTVYGLASEHLTNIHGVAVAAAVDVQFGTSYRSGIDAATLTEIN